MSGDQAIVAQRATSVERPKIRRSFIENAATVFGAQVGRIAIILLLEICYARFLGPAGRGQMSLCAMAIGVGVLAGGLGGEIPIVLWSADNKKRMEHWLSSIVLAGTSGSIFVSILWCVLYWIWHPQFLKGITNGLAVLVLASLPASIAFVYGLAFLTGQERFRERAGIILTNQLVVLALVVAFFIGIRPSAEAAMLASLLGILFGIFLVVRILRKHLDVSAIRLGELSYVNPALSLGFRGQLGNLATFFNYRLDVFIVNYFLNPEQVGLYAVAVLVSESLWQVPDAAALALLPREARDWTEKNSSFTCMVSRQVFTIALTMGVALALASPILIPLVFGAKFAASVSVVWWLLPGTVALAAGKVMSAALAARGMPQYSSMFACVTLVVTVALDLILIPRLGIRGAAIASSVAYLVDAGLVAMILTRKLNVTWSSLYIPTSAEAESYQKLWNRCVARLRPSAIS